MLPQGDFMNQPGRTDSFYHHVGAFADFISSHSFGHHHAGPVVAAVDAGAGAYQIPHAGEAEESGHLGAEMDAEPGHFHQSSGHQGSPAVVTKTDAVKNTAGQRHNILQCTAIFHAPYIIAAIYPENRAHIQVLHNLHRFRYSRGSHRGAGKPDAHFFRMIGAGKSHNLIGNTSHFFRNSF